MTNNSTDRLIMGAMRLGSWGANFTTLQFGEFIQECLELGIYRWDHADIYGDYSTEEAFGKIFQISPSLRDKISIITKCGIRRVCEARPDHKSKAYDSSADHIRSSVENSLRAFHTDHIDTLLLHRPDYLMEADEIGECIADLQSQGKVISFGVSNFTTSQIDLLSQYVKIQVHQIEVSLTNLGAIAHGDIDYAMRHDIEVQSWSPLSGGELFSKDRSDRARRIYQAACDLQEAYDAEADQIILAWVLRHPAQIATILGTTKIDRVRNSIKALDIHLSREDWYRLWQASTGKRLA